MALKATIDPRLIRPRSIAITAMRMVARTGIKYRLFTCDKYPENGNPLSLAKAQVSLDAEARVPKVANTSVSTSAEHIMVVTTFD